MEAYGINYVGKIEWIDAARQIKNTKRRVRWTQISLKSNSYCGSIRLMAPINSKEILIIIMGKN